MNRRWTQEDVARTIGRTKTRTRDPLTKPKKKANKYSAVRTKVGYLTFDSALEAKRYQELRILMLAKQCVFHRQVMFDLPGGVIYRCDFMIVWSRGLADGKDVTYEDCKGYQTQESKNKLKQVREIYGIEVELLADR